jgi:serine/threonine protein kinase
MSEPTDTNEMQPKDDSGPDPLGLIGQVIAGKYRVMSFINEGGFGKVYLGLNVLLPEQKVVIKFFTQVKARDRFEKEARILCKLDHPNICSLIDFLPTEKALIIPFINGEDLQHRLAHSGPLTADLFRKVAVAVSEAITFAHKRHIAHRDIKPSNIMIGINGNVYVIDFGIAKEIKTNATKTRGFFGTPEFAAPERWRGSGEYDPFISDIYELGITLFYLATGMPLYRDFKNPQYDEWNDSHTRRLSSQLRRVLMKATHPNPSFRYPSLELFAQELSAVARPYVRPSPKKKIALTAAAALIILLAVDFANYQFSFIPGGSIFGIWADQKVPQVIESPDTANVTIPPVPPPVMDTAQKDIVAPAEDTTKNTSGRGQIKPPEQNEKPVDAGNTTSTTAETEQKPTPSPTDDQADKTAEVSSRTADTGANLPPAPLPTLAIDVRPGGAYALTLDGNRVEAGQSLPVDRGTHRVDVEHGSYPLYNQAINIQQDTVVTIDLDRFFTGIDSVNFTAAIEPRDINYGFALTCNGATHTFDKQRVRDFYLRAGEWRIGAEVIPMAGSAADSPAIDSIVVRRMGDTDRQLIHGRSGTIRLVQPGAGKSMLLLIYWSANKHD